MFSPEVLLPEALLSFAILLWHLLTNGDGEPSAPCKWALRDIAKMMTHYLDLHAEHEPAERCRELGDALDKNRTCES